jgi:guanylate kinase
MRNVLIVLSGPSGVGKGTIAKILSEREDVILSVSCTTRKPRKGETDGKEYFFISKEDFKKKIDENGFLEYSEHFENYYGTPKDFVFDKMKENNVLLEIDVNGGLNVKKNFEDAVLIMVTSTREEIEKRLRKRKTEDEEKIKLRMQRIDYELSKSNLYDYVVTNDDLSVAVSEIENIIKKENEK